MPRLHRSFSRLPVTCFPALCNRIGVFPPSHRLRISRAYQPAAWFPALPNVYIYLLWILIVFFSLYRYIDSVVTCVTAFVNLFASTSLYKLYMYWICIHFNPPRLVCRADINARDNFKWTPLHHACHSGQEDLVQLLLENGAEMDAQTINGGTPLMRAIESSREAVVELLISKGCVWCYYFRE